MSHDSSSTMPSKTQTRGDVNYWPFEGESLDQQSLALIKRFRIYPSDKIRDTPAHVPYNSEKKDFLQKTGRESLEVFKYYFQLPDNEHRHLVLWDYNIGLVRITAFFKAVGHGKTMPAKMLSLNPGLKDICHSITGGSVSAQGYWMPFECAKAICATFCHPIAGALIPIFGPEFPLMCVRPEVPDYGRMVIDPDIIAQATHQCKVYHTEYGQSEDALQPPPPSSSGHDRPDTYHTPLRSHWPSNNYHRLVSPYSDTNDVERGSSYQQTRTISQAYGYEFPPVSYCPPTSSWQPVNAYQQSHQWTDQYHHQGNYGRRYDNSPYQGDHYDYNTSNHCHLAGNPELSAIPGERLDSSSNFYPSPAMSTLPAQGSPLFNTPARSSKRRYDPGDINNGYDAGYCQTYPASTPEASAGHGYHDEMSPAEKNAAYMLINLGAAQQGLGAIEVASSALQHMSGHSSKKQRTSSVEVKVLHKIALP